MISSPAHPGPTYIALFFSLILSLFEMIFLGPGVSCVCVYGGGGVEKRRFAANSCSAYFFSLSLNPECHF